MTLEILAKERGYHPVASTHTKGVVFLQVINYEQIIRKRGSGDIHKLNQVIALLHVGVDKLDVINSGLMSRCEFLEKNVNGMLLRTYVL